MLGLAGVLALVAGAAEVSIKVLPATPCVVQATLVRKLRASGLTVTQRPALDTLVVTLSGGDGRSLMVRARRGELPFERRVPASVEECAAVERVTVALISAWSAAATPEAVAEAPRQGSERTELPEPVGVLTEAPRLGSGRTEVPEPVSVVTQAPRLDSGRTEVPAPVSIVTQAPRPGSGRTEVPEPVSIVTQAPRLGSGRTEVPAPDSAVAAGPSPFRLEAAVLAGVSVGPTPVTTAAGSVLAGLSFGRWGVLIEAGVESERATRAPPVRVSAAMQWLSVSFRVAFEPIDSLTLDVALGARGWRVVSSATGVDVATDQNALTAGPALSAGLSWHIAGPLFLHFRPSVGLRAQPLSLSVAPLGEVLRLDPWSVGATLGALLRFE